MGTYADERAIMMGIDGSDIDHSDDIDYWIDRNGRRIKISTMSNGYLCSCIRMLNRSGKAKTSKHYKYLCKELHRREAKPMRDENVVKYRKLLKELQSFCSNEKGKAYSKFMSSKNNTYPTDYSRGEYAGYHAAINTILKHIGEMEQFAETDWKSVKLRESEFCDCCHKCN